MFETGYYHYLGGDDTIDRYEVEIGSLTYAIIGDEKTTILLEGHTFTYDQDDFHEFEVCFEFAPDGQKEYQDQINQVMQEVNDLDVEFKETNRQMLEFRPHVDQSGDMAGTSLVPSGSNRLADTKLAVAKVRNKVAKTQKSLKAKSKRLEMLLEQQSSALQVKVDAMNDLVARANEAIWSINLYLGKNEEVHQLAEGDPADAEAKVKIRQRVLFMDEECAELPNEDGIDVTQIEIFDEWLLKDGNLQRIIPDDKAIVALHPKRRGKKYGDPWMDAHMNAANLSYTYFLMRNGENIYRVYTDIVLGHLLFPTQREFEEIFFRDKYDHDVGERKVEPIKPGDKDYMEALDAADKKQRHYYRVLLILQGIFDRTKIFAPLPEGGVNVCSRLDHTRFLEFIREAEMVLEDDHEPFYTWLKRVNSQLDVGHRVIGNFTYSNVAKTSEYSPSRTHPANADTPDCSELHTIVRQDDKDTDYGGRYDFLYERTDTVYPKEYWKDPHVAKTRARCYVRKNDDFILDFDAADVASMEYFIESRKAKKEYRTMVPLLERAIAAKKQEKKDEEPFRKLLIGAVNKSHGVSLEDAAELIPELINWWKYKNRTHRALTSDDTKAYKMILAEYRIRQKREAERTKAKESRSSVQAAIMKHNNDVIMIAHKSGGKYVAYVPHNDKNVWVKEQIWTRNGTTKAIYMSEEKEWRLVDKRYLRWEIFYTSDRWDDWNINPRPATVLTDPEIEDIIERAVKSAEKIVKKSIKKESSYERDAFFHVGANRSRKRKQRFIPLCFTMSDTFELKLYYTDQGPLVPGELFYSNESKQSEVGSTEIVWKRTADEISCILTRMSTGLQWERDREGFRRRGNSILKTKGDVRPWPEEKVIKIWDDNIAIVDEEHAEYRKAKAVHTLITRKYKHITDIICDYFKQKQIDAIRKEYFEEHGDPELWEDHLEEQKIKDLGTHQIDIALCLMAERAIDAVGMTMGEVMDKAVEYGLFKEDMEFSRRWHVDELDKNIPREFVIPALLQESGS